MSDVTDESIEVVIFDFSKPSPVTERIYNFESAQKVVQGEKFQERVRSGIFFGEYGMPHGGTTQRQHEISLENVCVKYEDVWFEGTLLKATMIPNGPKADLVRALRYKTQYDIGMRTYTRQLPNGEAAIDHIVSFDITAPHPSVTEIEMDEIGLKIIEEFNRQAVSPEWDKVGKVHDWRNYVSEDVQKIWNRMPILARCVIVSMCEERAGREDWDV